MIRLVRPDARLLDAALTGDDALAAALGVAVAPGWVSFTGALRTSRDAAAAVPATPRWGTCLFVAEDPPELVGWGGFKGPPARETLEIGYEIAESRQGRGLATAAARAMVEEAFADERVTRVIAHTLPEHNASTRVLEKLGFWHDGEAEEDGQRVWRFALERQSAIDTPAAGS